MCVHGDGSRRDLLKWMPPNDNLQTTWIMFDHVKHLEDWMTFTCHMYDPFYYKVITIVICDMQFEDTKA
jgi:hypothetical protein